MSFEEKVTWVNLAVSAIVAAVYFFVVGGQLGERPVTEIAYLRPMIFAVGAIILLTIVGSIAMAIGTAIAAEIRGQGSASDVGRTDERDARIGRRADRVGYYLLSALMLGVLILTVSKYEHFWIANALFASFAVVGMVVSIVKLVAYRRGF